MRCRFTVLLAMFFVLSPTAFAAEIHLIEGDLVVEVPGFPHHPLTIKLPESPRSAAVVFRGAFELFDSVKLKNALRDAKERHPGETVYLYIDSPGGAYSEALKILDLMEEFRTHTPIVTVACGPGAFSAGAMIWLGGTECQIIGGSVVGFYAPYYADTRKTTPELIANVRKRMMKNAWRLPAFREYAQDMADYVEALFADQGAEGFLVAFIDWKKKRLELDMWTQKVLAELPRRWLAGYDEAWDSFLKTSSRVPSAYGFLAWGNPDGGVDKWYNKNERLGLPSTAEYLQGKGLIKEDIPPISIYSATFTEEDALPKFGNTEIDSHVFLTDDAVSLRPLFQWHWGNASTAFWNYSVIEDKKNGLFSTSAEGWMLKLDNLRKGGITEKNITEKDIIDGYLNAITLKWQRYLKSEGEVWTLKTGGSYADNTKHYFFKTPSYPPFGMCRERLPLKFITKLGMWDR